VNLTDLRTEIGATLTAAGIRCYDWTAPKIVPPCAIVNPAVPFVTHGGGGATHAAPYVATFIVQLLTGRGPSAAVADQLDDMIATALGVLVGADTTPGDGWPVAAEVLAPLLGEDDQTVGAEITVSYPLTMKEE
jgi:hypothetical protein